MASVIEHHLHRQSFEECILYGQSVGRNARCAAHTALAKAAKQTEEVTVKTCFFLYRCVLSGVVFQHHLLPAVDRFACESLRHPEVKFLFMFAKNRTHYILVLSLASGQATIDPTAYRENRIRQLKEAGSNFASVHVKVVNVACVIFVGDTLPCPLALPSRNKRIPACRLQAAVEAYPHTWEVDTTLATLIAKYSDLEDGARIDEASPEPGWKGAHTQYTQCTHTDGDMLSWMRVQCHRAPV